MHLDGSDLEAQIRHLKDLGLDALRKLSGQVLGAVPVNHGAHLLRRRLAYELQARAMGDLSVTARRSLRRLHQSFKADPQHKPPSRRLFKAGTVLTRNWQGVLHQVHVMREGFDYRGERFSSLSEVARRITGTRWSGPRFFGLKATT